MKRSEINHAISRAKDALKELKFALPLFAVLTPEQWKQAGPEYDRIRKNGLGWDITDFGGDDFRNYGAVLFTLRNGNHAQPELGTPYAEKIIVLEPGQRLPLHIHFSKTEDIINRGGGVMVMELYNAKDDDSVDEQTEVSVFCDAVERRVKAGEIFELQPGESITLPPRLYHRFWASRDGGVLVCGEVSSVNDDNTDNLFAEPVSRFAEIDEDEPPDYLLCNEYPA